MSVSGFPKVRLDLTALGKGRVQIDGRDVPGVEKIVVAAGGGRFTRVMMILSADVEVTAHEADVTINAAPLALSKPEAVR